MTEILEELKSMIALKMCGGIGDATAHKLITHCGSASSVFKEKKKHLSSIPGIPERVFDLLQSGIDFKAVEKELKKIEKARINYVIFRDSAYPRSLLSIDNPPLILFFKGSIEILNLTPCISIVGTRLATGYGQDAITELFSAIKDSDTSVISGLAAGIDIAAHKEALNCHLPTFGIVGHGLHTVYPGIHKPYAEQMCKERGGLISEYFYDEKPNRENFPKRNRIIAGLSYATIVIEAAKKGGALITAEFASGYHRKVFALPGRYNDKYSEGCNALIRTGRAKAILSIDSLVEELGFKKRKIKKKQTVDLTSDELNIVRILHESSKVGLDNISTKSQLSISSCSALLFNLEMKGVVRSLPGKSYELC